MEYIFSISILISLAGHLFLWFWFRWEIDEIIRVENRMLAREERMLKVISEVKDTANDAIDWATADYKILYELEKRLDKLTEDNSAGIKRDDS